MPCEQWLGESRRADKKCFAEGDGEQIEERGSDVMVF